MQNRDYTVCWKLYRNCAEENNVLGNHKRGSRRWWKGGFVFGMWGLYCAHIDIRRDYAGKLYALQSQKALCGYANIYLPTETTTSTCILACFLWTYAWRDDAIRLIHPSSRCESLAPTDHMAHMFGTPYTRCCLWEPKIQEKIQMSTPKAIQSLVWPHIADATTSSTFTPVVL